MVPGPFLSSQWKPDTERLRAKKPYLPDRIKGENYHSFEGAYVPAVKH